MLFKWIKIDSIIVIISAVIVVRRSGVVISSKEINLMFGYTLKNIICSWRVDTQTSCRWKASLLINVGRINLLQNYYSTEIKTSCNLSAWFERFEEQLCCNEAVPHSLAPTPTLFCPHPPFHLFVSPKRFSVFGTKHQLIWESFRQIVFHIFDKGA